MIQSRYKPEQPVIRPPSEWKSLLVRLTRGCKWNRCRFCDIYPHMQVTQVRGGTIPNCSCSSHTSEQRQVGKEFHAMIEEYKISLFAQAIKNSLPRFRQTP